MADFSNTKSASPELAKLLSQAHTAEAKDRAFFSTIPWTSALMEDSAFGNLPMISRLPQPLTGEDSFLAETMNTPFTIPHLLAYYLIPKPLGTPSSHITQVRWLLHVGEKLNGWPKIMHGGVQSFLLDEIMAFLLGCGKRVEGAVPLALNTVTAELNVKYKRAFVAPAVVVVDARLVRREGRRLYTEAEVRDEKGTVIASGEAVFVSIQPGSGPKM